MGKAWIEHRARYVFPDEILHVRHANDGLAGMKVVHGGGDGVVKEGEELNKLDIGPSHVG